MGSRKMVLKILFAGKHWRNRYRKQIYGQGERGRGVRCIERVTWKLTLPYVKQIANGNLLYGSGKLKKGLCINLDQWDWEGDEWEVQKGGDVYILMADSC